MPLRNKKHFIFDMDGTLTVAVHDFEYMRNALGLPEGLPILESIDSYPEEQKIKLMHKLDTLEIGYAQAAVQQEGAEALLAYLSLAGHSLGILTRNSVELAYITLEACGLLKYFDKDAILGRDSSPPKPHPDGIVQLLDHWQADKTEAVMIGDFKFDLLAGRAAGVMTVHISTNSQFLWPDDTDFACDHLDQIRFAAGQAMR